MIMKIRRKSVVAFVKTVLNTLKKRLKNLNSPSRQAYFVVTHPSGDVQIPKIRRTKFLFDNNLSEIQAQEPRPNYNTDVVGKFFHLK